MPTRADIIVGAVILALAWWPLARRHGGGACLGVAGIGACLIFAWLTLEADWPIRPALNAGRYFLYALIIAGVAVLPPVRVFDPKGGQEF